MLAFLLLLPLSAAAKNEDLSSWTVNLSESSLASEPKTHDYGPQVEISGSTLHVLWLTNKGDQRQIYYRRSLDGGRSWEAKKLLFSDAASSVIAEATSKRLEVRGDTVHVFFGAYVGDWHGTLMYIRSSDGGATFDAPRTLFKADQYWHVQDVLTASAGNTVLVGFRHQGDRSSENSFVVLRTDDEGGSFQQSVAYRVNEGSAWSAADLAISGENIYVLYRHARYHFGLLNSELYLAASRDGGATFQSRIISVPSRNGRHKSLAPQHERYVPKIAAAGDSLHVVWQGIDEDDVQSLFYRRSADAGATFGPAVNISRQFLAKGRVPWRGQETVAAKGNHLYVLFVEYGSGRILLRRSENDGETFEDLQELSPASGQYTGGGQWPALAFDPRDPSGEVVHVLWSCPTHIVSNDGGRTFSGPVLLSPHFSWATGGCGTPAMALDGGGLVHVVIDGYYYADGGFGDSDIFYRRRTVLASSVVAERALNLTTDDHDKRYDTMQVPASASINFSSAMTVEAWVLMSRRENREGYFLYKADGGGRGVMGSYLLGQTADGNAIARILTTGGSFAVTGGTPLRDGVWTHIAMTYEAGGGPNNLRLYINGILAGTHTATGNLLTGAGILFLGGDGTYRYYADVSIDELRLWNRALDQTEIVAGMLAMLKGTEHGLAAYYTFNNTAKDLSGHGNHGILMYKENFVKGIFAASAQELRARIPLPGPVILGWNTAAAGQRANVAQ